MFGIVTSVNSAATSSRSLNGFDAVAGFENVIPGIFQDVRGGYPHEHLVLNDEDDGRLALARRLRPAPGLPVRPQSRVRSYSCS